ncbi:hypothetical protein [Nostoc sp.]|uniref:hypothetical protein n=1 Tax=Nostoc sp. TaxID=1180 RepID=UPI002FF959FD
MSMSWEELRDALAKQTGWKIAAYENDFGVPRELKITWECSIFYYVGFEVNEEAKRIHTIIITRQDGNLSTQTVRKIKLIPETNDNDIVIATIKKEIPFKKADPIPVLIT